MKVPVPVELAEPVPLKLLEDVRLPVWLLLQDDVPELLKEGVAVWLLDCVPLKECVAEAVWDGVAVRDGATVRVVVPVVVKLGVMDGVKLGVIDGVDVREGV